MFSDIITMRLLIEPGHLEEGYPITTVFEKKDFQVFLQTNQ